MAKTSKKVSRTSGPKGNLTIDEKEKKRRAFQERMNKEHGDNTIAGGPGGEKIRALETLSTGDYGLDRALGGGIPKGRITEIYGAASSGKTTLALSVVRECVNEGGFPLYIDAENAFDPSYAEKMGITSDKYHFVQPIHGEEAFDIAEKGLEEGIYDLIIFDSVAAMIPKAEIEGEIYDQRMGLQAQLMGKGCRRLAQSITKSNAAVIFINQIREKIGVMFGNPETTPGGKALLYFSSVRLDTRQKEKLTDPKTGEPYGIITNVKIVKNKISVPNKAALITIVAGKNGEWGVSKIGSIINMALELDLIERSGAWFGVPAMPEIRVQGIDNMKNAVVENKELRDYLQKEIEAFLENERNEIAPSIYAESEIDADGFDEDELIDEDEFLE